MTTTSLSSRFLSSHMVGLRASRTVMVVGGAVGVCADGMLRPRQAHVQADACKKSSPSGTAYCTVHRRVIRSSSSHPHWLLASPPDSA